MVILNLGFSSSIIAQKIVSLKPVSIDESDENLLYPLSKIPLEESYMVWVYSSAYSLLYDFSTLATHNWHIVSSSSRKWVTYQKHPDLSDKNRQQALIVFLHGLDGHPSRWEYFLVTLEAEKKYDLWSPQIPHKGNTPASSAIKELLPDIQEYMNKWPERPIIIIGSSNGARLGLIIETKLRNHHGKIMLVSVAGLHGATQRIWTRRWLLKTDQEFYDEINFPSQHARETITEARKPLPAQTLRSYIFYAADNDHSIMPMNSCFPVLGHHEQFFYVKHTGHISIASAISDHLLETIEDWLTTNTSQ